MTAYYRSALVDRALAEQSIAPGTRSRVDLRTSRGVLPQGHLAGVSQVEWEAIPDVGDYSLKYKQSKRREIFTPMPDHVIEGARNESAVSVTN